MQVTDITNAITAFFCDKEISYTSLKDVDITNMVVSEKDTFDDEEHASELSGTFSISTAWINFRYNIRQSSGIEDATTVIMDISTGDRMISIEIPRFIIVEMAAMFVTTDLLRPDLNSDMSLVKFARKELLQRIIMAYCDCDDRVIVTIN